MSKFYQSSWRTWGLMCLLAMIALPTQAQVTLPHHDPFNYTVGQTLKSQTGWAEITGGTGDDILVASGSLNSALIPASTNNKITFAGAGIDVTKLFTEQTTGTVYYSLLLNVTDVTAATDANGGYLAGFTETLTSNFGGTLWTKKDGTGFQIGTEVRSANAANTTWTTGTPYTVNTTYLVVIAYTFNGGASNDGVKLWVNPANTGTEPTPTITDSHTSTDLVNIGKFLLRQDSAAETPALEIDEVRIGTTWTSVVPTVVADVTPPTFTATFPKVQNIGVTTLDLLSNMNEAGKTYFVILPDGATTPSPAQIKAGTDASNANVTLKGTINHANANTDYTANVTGLTGATNYDVYAVGEDVSNNLNTAQKIDVLTLAPDVTAPSFTATYPKTANIANTALDLLSNIDEAGKTHFVVLPDGATAPSPAQIKAGTDASNANVALKGTITNTNANTEYSVNITGLTATTAYDIYVVAEDNNTPTPNLGTAVKVDVTTTGSDAIAPTFTATYPKVSNVLAYSLKVLSNINEVGKTYFVILPNDATAPTSAQVKAGTDASNANVTLKGTIDNTTANTEFSFDVTSLLSATNYDIYVVAEDAVPNVQASPTKIDVLTQTADVTAPAFTATYPKTSNIGSTNFRLLTNLNEVGKTYFVVLPDGATPPTASQVKNGQNATGATVANNLKGTIDNVAGNTEYNATVSGLTQATAYDVYAVAEDSPAFNASNLQSSATKVDVSTIAPSTGDIIENFNTCVVGTNIATWGEYSVTGAIKWACTTFGRLPTPSNAPQINAGSAAGVAEPSEDWLISPSLDLSAFSGPTLDFWSRTRFAGAPLTLKVSTNYTTGDPNTASWSDLPATFPAENSDVWTETKEIDLTAYKGTNTRIAFVYTATSTAGARWTLDDIKIYNKAPQIVLTKAQTLDMVTWNLEWFGDATNGPTDETLQRNNIKTVIEQIDADLYCLQEVTNQNGLNNFQALVTDLAPLGYTGVRVTHSSSFGDAQQARAFIYKTSVFSNVTTQVLPLTGFVDNRQPVLFKGDATIEGTTKTVNVINIHAKATATGTETADFTTRQSNSVALKTYLDANLGTQNVVFLGDFNDDLDVSVVTPNPSPYKNFVDDVAGYATPSKTELSDKNITTFIGRTEPIDHIVLSNEMSALMYAGSLRREDYTSVITNYANTTSDHYPVSVRFQLGPVTPDATAPTFTATYPKVSNITNFDFKIESAINEAGKSYYVVVPDGASAPTALQVKSGQNASGAQVTANFRGAITHNAANVPSIVTITGIALLTDYDVYVVAEDIIPNLQASPMKIDVTAAPADIVPPIFTAGYPKADQITSISFRAVSSLNEAGKTYFIVLPNNASAPTSAQVKAGTNSSDVAVSANFKGTITNTTASTDFTANIIGTVDNVDYDVYFVAEDGFNNLQLAPVKVDLKTVTSAEDDITRYLSVYPNPAQHALTVRLMQNPLIQKGAVRLVNVMGQGVQQGNLTTRNEVSEHTFDVSSLPAGVYILELSEGKRKFFYKVVVR